MSNAGRWADITALMARRLRCPGCMRRFRSQDISTLESAPRFGVFRLTCPMCHSKRLIFAVWGRNGVRTFMNDLDEQEWVYYRYAPPIATEDLLRFHTMLQAYDGDLSDVLEDPLFDESE